MALWTGVIEPASVHAERPKTKESSL